MSTSSRARPAIVQTGHGKALDFGPAGVATVMLDGEQTGGTLSVIMSPTVPGDSPPLHVHEHDDELFLVVEGTISYFLDDHWTDVGPGGVVYFPKGTPHCYRNNGTTIGHHWIITTPSGFEQFFARFAEELRRSDGPDPQRVMSIMEEHGYRFLGETPGSR